MRTTAQPRRVKHSLPRLNPETAGLEPRTCWCWGGSSRARPAPETRASLGPAPPSGDNGAASLVSRGAPWAKAGVPEPRARRGSWSPGRSCSRGTDPGVSSPRALSPQQAQESHRESQAGRPWGGGGATHLRTEGPRRGRQRGGPLADVAAGREGPKPPGQSLGLRPHKERPQGPASPRGGAGESLWVRKVSPQASKGERGRGRVGKGGGLEASL